MKTLTVIDWLVWLRDHGCRVHRGEYYPSVSAKGVFVKRQKSPTIGPRSRSGATVRAVGRPGPAEAIDCFDGKAMVAANAMRP